ncbi:MAG: DUF6197 family protein [Pseudonocardiaceae bacterium]
MPTTHTPMTTRQVLLAAADLIEHDGLCQGEYWPGQGNGTPYTPGLPCCVIGSIAVTAGVTIEHSLPTSPLPAVDVLCRVVLKHRVPQPDRLVDWNDQEDRTAGEVAAAMRGAAAALPTR